MENCLFRILNRDEYIESGFLYPSMLLTGYSLNQKAFLMMANGYKVAADIIAVPDSKDIIIDNDELVYPFFTCYRNAIELLFKAVLMNRYMPFNRGMEEVERRKLGRLLSNHNIRILFVRIRDSILEKGYSGYNQLFNDIWPYIVAYDRFDPSITSMQPLTDSSKNAKRNRSQITVLGYDIQYTYKNFKDLWALLLELYNRTENDWCNNRFEY